MDATGPGTLLEFCYVILLLLQFSPSSLLPVLFYYATIFCDFFFITNLHHLQDKNQPAHSFVCLTLQLHLHAFFACTGPEESLFHGLLSP